MIPFWKSELYLDDRELKTDLGEDNFIFVGSSTDMFAKKVPSDWISKVIIKCLEHKKNKYLFQSKYPKRFAEFGGSLCYLNLVFGTTIESNRQYKEMGDAPTIKERYEEFKYLSEEKMLTIEPIMDFDLEPFVQMIKEIKPDWVNIGADSKGHKLPEPSKEKTEKLIKELNKFTKVINKDNLKRILK
jgi:protein gp37